jgi:hypothetical protein
MPDIPIACGRCGKPFIVTEVVKGCPICPADLITEIVPDQPIPPVSTKSRSYRTKIKPEE